MDIKQGMTLRVTGATYLYREVLRRAGLQFDATHGWYGTVTIGNGSTTAYLSTLSDQGKINVKVVEPALAHSPAPKTITPAELCQMLDQFQGWTCKMLREMILKANSLGTTYVDREYPIDPDTVYAMLATKE